MSGHVEQCKFVVILKLHFQTSPVVTESPSIVVRATENVDSILGRIGTWPC